jgi:HEAT repeat protein
MSGRGGDAIRRSRSGPVPLLRSLRLPVLGSLTALALTLAPVAAQSGRLQIPPPVKPAQGEPEQPVVVPTETPAATAPVSLWDPPANLAEQIFLEFETARSPAPGVRAAALERLRALGLETRETALKALGSEWGPTVLLAAELMEWVGLTVGEDPSDVAALVEAASRTGLVEAAGRCLDAALRLNNGALPGRAVTLLAHPNRNVRVLAEGRLQRAPEPVHLERLLQFVEHGRDADVRLRAARLLAAFQAEPEVRLALRRALRDESAEVAFSASATLAGTARPEQIAFVVSELRQRCSGAEAGYLAFALLLQQQEHDAPLIPQDALPRLEVLLDDADLFASGVAGACLAEYAYRAGPESTPATWRSKVPFALVRATSGIVFYPQYARFSPLAEGALERISGEEFLDRREWIAWMDGLGREGLDFLRGSLLLDATALPRLRVAWTRAGAEATPRVLAGTAAWLLPSERLVGVQQLAALHRALEQSGLLGSVAGSNRFGADGEPIAAVLELSAGNQRKRLIFRGAALGAAQEVLTLCDRAWEEAAWQVLAPAGESGRVFVASQLDAMESADPAARAAAMTAMSRGRLAALDAAVLQQWCVRLLATPGVPAQWDAALASETLTVLAAHGGDADTALALVDAALMAPDTALAAPLADAAAAIEEPLRTRVLARGIRLLGLDGARRLIADARLTVRVAAIAALPELGVAAVPLLREALAADEMPMQLAALRGLGELGDAASLDEVIPFTAVGQAHELRKEAVWALGRFGEPRALPGLQEVAVAEQPALRVSALLAIAAIPGDEASIALGALFPEYAGTALEGSYLRALLERGAAGARRTLQPYLVSRDPVLERRAALLGGLLGDPAVARSLMNWLPSDPRNPELLEALASTLCVDFRTLPDPAGTYLAWWRDHSGEAPSAWFADAARGSGFEFAPMFADGGQPRASVAELLKVLETGPAHLRASATYFLHGLTGVDGQIVLAGTPTSEVSRRTEPWRAWLDG